MSNFGFSNLMKLDVCHLTNTFRLWADCYFVLKRNTAMLPCIANANFRCKWLDAFEDVRVLTVFSQLIKCVKYLLALITSELFRTLHFTTRLWLSAGFFAATILPPAVEYVWPCCLASLRFIRDHNGTLRPLLRDTLCTLLWSSALPLRACCSKHRLELTTRSTLGIPRVNL